MIVRVGVAVGIALACSAVGAAYAQSNKPIVSATYYEDRATKNVSGATSTLTFAQTPADKYVTVTRVACRMTIGATQTLADVALTIGTTSGADDIGRSQAIEALNSVVAGPGGNIKYILFNQPTKLKIGPGRFPSLTFSTDYLGNSSSVKSINAACTIVGDLSDN